MIFLLLILGFGFIIAAVLLMTYNKLWKKFITIIAGLFAIIGFFVIYSSIAGKIIRYILTYLFYYTLFYIVVFFILRYLSKKLGFSHLYDERNRSKFGFFVLFILLFYFLGLVIFFYFIEIGHCLSISEFWDVIKSNAGVYD